jgi:hypothetical protein
VPTPDDLHDTEEMDLFDIVPWEYGFVHSGALAWLLARERWAPLVLGAARNAPWDADARVVTPPLREVQVGPRRFVDLAFKVAWPGQDDARAVALETKVNDLLKPEQLDNYRARGYLPVLYMPGLTGLLAGRNAATGAGEALLTGAMLADALRPHLDELPWLLAGYARTVDQEALRFNAACAYARGDSIDIQHGKTQERALLDVAFTVAVIEQLQDRHAADPASTVYPVTELAGRDVAFDRGFFWADTHTPPAARAGVGNYGFYIDLICTKATGERAIVIKAGFGDDAKRMAAIFDVARAAGPPDEGWVPGRRQVTKNSVGCWKRPLGDMMAAEAADIAVQGAAWIRARGSPARR